MRPIRASQLPPEVEAYFEEQRREQGTLNKIAQINGTLAETKRVMLSNMTALADRGHDLEACVEQSDDLLESSFAFRWGTMSRWNKFCYQIRHCLCWRWFCCCPLWWWDACCPTFISERLVACARPRKGLLGGQHGPRALPQHYP